jgi:5'-nucleotidase
MFQGTLESNLSEGAAVVRAYNAFGYVAAAIGNHEFDYGPVGPDETARTPGEDPRGSHSWPRTRSMTRRGSQSRGRT